MLLEIKDIHVHYGKIAALKGITATVDQGEIVTLIGANGAGKTTTLKTISGLRPLSSGSIVFEGNDISKMPGHKRVVAGIGQSPEGRGCFPGMTVEENLLMGAYTRKGDVSKELNEAYELFPRLAERKTQAAGTMSGGEQQMLAIGRALMSKPKVLLLDEPSMGLAPMLVQQIFTIIQEINRRGTTVLLVEQNAQQALQIAHRAYVLETGRVVKSAQASELLDDPEVRAAYLGGELGGDGADGVSGTRAESASDTASDTASDGPSGDTPGDAPDGPSVRKSDG
ncbi:ABC transporter ATP-binding protein [Actinomadura kijaniata]|uniref:ABC transporter ATP-binding protein n=1 Tax=Actinomadura kijaniata TaxID=46161 RepID=UPI0009FECDD9|nr:ABC transporter ATP-binding protein [Actinomadura kijaniata]